MSMSDRMGDGQLVSTYLWRVAADQMGGSDRPGKGERVSWENTGPFKGAVEVGMRGVD